MLAQTGLAESSLCTLEIESVNTLKSCLCTLEVKSTSTWFQLYMDAFYVQLKSSIRVHVQLKSSIHRLGFKYTQTLFQVYLDLIQPVLSRLAIANPPHARGFYHPLISHDIGYANASAFIQVHLLSCISNHVVQKSTPCLYSLVLSEGTRLYSHSERVPRQ